MNNSGIISQYGFLYQRKVFILFALENANTKQRCVFEGCDDIEIAVDEALCALNDNGARCVQVKSGSIGIETLCKVFCNWLLLDKHIDMSLELFSEKTAPLIDKPLMLDKIYSYILEGKDKKRNSIAWKAYNKFNGIIDKPDELKGRIERVIDCSKHTVCSLSDLDKRMEDVFFENYCRDIKDYSIAKSKRLEYLISLINREIDASIKSKMPYTLIFSDLMRMIMQVCEQINDHRYSVNSLQLKKSFEDNAKDIVAEKVLREVKQLFLVDDNEGFVANGIINELFYKDFREVYAVQREVDIVNLEQNAYENFIDAKFSLDETDVNLPKKLYQKTTEKQIGSSLLPDSPIYRKGCYIYLTGDNVDLDNQITWGDEDE